MNTDKEAQKRALETWQKPLSKPVAVPKPSSTKKKRAKGVSNDTESNS